MTFACYTLHLIDEIAVQRNADPMLMSRAFAGAILFSLWAMTCYGDVARSTPRANLLAAADTFGCSTKLLGNVVVATLNRVPFVTLSANGHSVTLIVDTGAERTVLTPEAAKQIGAHPRGSPVPVPLAFSTDLEPIQWAAFGFLTTTTSRPPTVVRSVPRAMTLPSATSSVRSALYFRTSIR